MFLSTVLPPSSGMGVTFDTAVSYEAHISNYKNRRCHSTEAHKLRAPPHLTTKPLIQWEHMIVCSEVI